MKHNHQKNGYSKILGIIFVIAFLAAIVSVIYYAQSTDVQLPSFLPKNHDTKTTATFQDYQYDFSVVYPKRFELDVTGAQPNYFKAEGAVHADISIPKSEFPKTNLSVAHISLAAKNRTTLADCQTYVTSGGLDKKMTKTVKLDAGTFYTDMYKDGTAGTAYGTQIYRILHNGLCIEAALNIGISNIGNYDPSSGIQKVNEADVWNDLTAILATLKFTTPVSGETPVVATEGVVHGHVDIGPNCPVEQAGEPCTTSPDAYDGVQILVYSVDRSRIITKTTLDAKGNYTTNVDAGIYYVTYTSIYSFYQPPMRKISVVAGQSVIQNFSIDTGIR